MSKQAQEVLRTRQRELERRIAEGVLERGVAGRRGENYIRARLQEVKYLSTMLDLYSEKEESHDG